MVPAACTIKKGSFGKIDHIEDGVIYGPLDHIPEEEGGLGFETRSWMVNTKTLINSIGHQATADYLGIPVNRVNVKLDPGDQVYVCQLMGGRLPEGYVIKPGEPLPDGFYFQLDQWEVMP